MSFRLRCQHPSCANCLLRDKYPGYFQTARVADRIARELELARPFIRLPYRFDAALMAQEIDALDPGAWMAHPSRLAGNSALALISRNAGENDHFDGPMQPTRHLAACPYTAQAMASFGEVLGRSRLMRLAPGAEVAMHVDFNYHWYSRVRIHVPVTTDPRVRFYCAGESVHMRPGEAWIFNSWRRHRVVNASDSARIHLVMDLAGSSRFWATIRSMEAFDPEADRDRIDACQAFVSPDPDAPRELRTERYNAAPVMAPGELDAIVSDLVADFEKHRDNDPRIVAEYRRMLFDFSKDWRETWLLHGLERSGWARYRELIDAVYEKMHPDRRAIVTSSNQIGVNPIIVQRILRAVLAAEDPGAIGGTAS